MKRKKTTIFSALLSVITIVSSTVFWGCNSSELETSTDDVTIWTAAATDKIRRDNVEIYQPLMDNASIDLRVIGGEVESHQIIMTTNDEEIDSYVVKTSELTCGEDIFDEENITVYHEKYVYLEGSEYYKDPGYYPDCLVPFEAVEKLGENTISKNSNQGLYVEFDVPENQPTGTYTGSIEIVVGGSSKIVPVTLTVSNTSIGVETHSKSCFSVMWYHGKGELDYTPEMMDTYVKALMDYRLGANYIMYRSDSTDPEIAYYAKKVVEYAKMPECVNYGMQFNVEYITEYDFGNGLQDLGASTMSYDEDVMLKYFLSFYEEGLKENVNPFEKLFLKGFDEPQLNGTMNAVAVGAHQVRKLKEQAIAIMNEKGVANTELLNKMHASLLDMPHVVTTSIVSNDIDPQTMDITYCPFFNSCATESAREKYREYDTSESWWYGCNVPVAPYPTYHLDNTLLSPRVLSWMQADYDIVGNLYWSCDHYANVFADDYVLEDQYEGEALRCTAAWGEGLLFYPGAKYGIDGPLPSMRLQAIRDGLEEYEMIYKLKQAYQEKGYDENTVLRSLYDSMYSNAQLYDWITTDIFAVCRDVLISALELAESEANLMFTDIRAERGKMIYEFFVKDGYEPAFSDSFTHRTRVTEGGKIYTVICGSEETVFDLSLVIEDKNYDISFNLSSALGDFYEADVFNKDSAIVSGSNQTTLSVEMVIGKTVNELEATEIQYARLKFAPAVEISQKADIGGKIVSGITTNTTKVIIELYYDGDEPINVSLGYTCTNTKAVTPIDAIVLKKGINTIVCDGMATINWKNIGKFKAFRLEIGEKGDVARDNIYFIGMSIFKN